MLDALMFTADKDIIYIVIVLGIVSTFGILYIFADRMIFNRKYGSYSMMFDCVPSGIFLCQKDDVLTLKYFNNNFLYMLGYTKEELSIYHDNKLINLISKDDLGFAFKKMYEQLSIGNNLEIKVRLIKKDGSTVWVLWKGKKARKRNKDFLSCVILNINDYIHSENKQKIDEERYRIVAESSDSVIYEYNIKEGTIFYTHKYKYKFGEDPITENYPDSFIESGRLHKDDIKKFLSEYNKILYGKPSGRIEIRIRKATGEFIWCEMRYTSIFDDNGIPIRVIGKYVDVDKVKRETESLKKASQLDSFTGLYNKTSILEIIESYLNDNKERKHALFFIDIDDFKSVNDNHGHVYGDKLLSQIVEVIKNHFRHSDLIGRIGGDEFIILVKDYIDEGFIHEKASALCANIAQLHIEEKDISVTVSAGITLYPSHGNMLSALYEKADVALYAAKSEGKNKYKIYSEELSANIYNKAYKGKLINTESSAAKKKISDFADFLLDLSYDLNGFNSINESIHYVMQRFCRAFSADRAYIYEFDITGKAKMMLEWHNESVKSISDTEPALVLRNDYENNFNADNIYYCKNATEFSNPILHIKNDTLSFMQCKLTENGVFKGFIGYDICKEARLITREEIEAIIYIAKILEKIYIPRRLKELTACDTDKKIKLINEFSSPVYVAGAENNNILFANDYVKYNNLKKDGNIFTLLCKSNICEDCSIKNLREGEYACCNSGGGISAVCTAWEDRQSLIIYDGRGKDKEITA